MLLYLLNFAIDVANVINAMVPISCYLMGCALLIGSILALWRMGDNPRFSKGQHATAIGLFLLSVLLLNFDKLLTAANRSMGSAHTASLGGGLLAYQTAAPNVLGAGPAETVINLVGLFAFFFSSIGALFALNGLLRLRHVRRDGDRYGPAFVQMAAGVVLMNLDVLAPGLLNYGG